MIKQCKSCGSNIPYGRIRQMPNTQYCVNCSDEDKVSAIPVIHHKTGNEIQIVRNPEAAAEFHRMASRVGFGTLRGLKAGKSGGTEAKISITKRPVFIAHADEATYNKLGEKVMYTYDLLGKEKAIKIINDAVVSRLISDGQGNKLTKIVNALEPAQPATIKPASDRYLPNNKIKQSNIVSDEVAEVIKFWRR